MAVGVDVPVVVVGVVTVWGVVCACFVSRVFEGVFTESNHSTPIESTGYGGGGLREVELTLRVLQ